MTATLDKIDGSVAPDIVGTSAAPAAKAAKPSRPALWRLVDWRVVVAALLVGALLHLGLVLSAPVRPRNGAFERIRDILPVNRVVLLPAPVAGKQPVPFMMPDALYAVCRYDLSVDSLRISTSLLEKGWTLSLHTRIGDNYYTILGQPKRTDVSFVVLPGIGAADMGPAPRKLGTSDMLIASPTVEGLVVVRAPLKGIAYREETAAALARTTCSPVKR